MSHHWRITSNVVVLDKSPQPSNAFHHSNETRAASTLPDYRLDRLLLGNSRLQGSFPPISSTLTTTLTLGIRPATRLVGVDGMLSMLTRPGIQGNPDELLAVVLNLSRSPRLVFFLRDKRDRFVTLWTTWISFSDFKMLPKVNCIGTEIVSVPCGRTYSA